MEQSRLFIAIGISFLIFFLWSMFFAPKPPEKPVEAMQQETQAQSAKPDVDNSQAPVMPAATEKPNVIAKEDAPARKIKIETPLYQMTLSEKGAAITSTVLKEYKESTEKDSAHKELIHKEAQEGTILMLLSGSEAQGLEKAVFTTDYKGDLLDVAEQPAQLRFQYRTASGLVVEKVYKFIPDSYLIDLTVSLFNGSDQAYTGNLTLELQNTLAKDSGRYAFEGPSGLINDKLEQVNVKKIKEQNSFSGQIGWVAIEDRYFMTSIIPAPGTQGQMKLLEGENTIKNQVVIDFGEVPANQNRSLAFRLFLGPKSVSLLKSYNCKLDRAINFGWFDFLAKPCLWFMNFIYKFIPNYGVAIILLTILSRGIFWPLAKKCLLKE